jgi:hypothetical protein
MNTTQHAATGTVECHYYREYRSSEIASPVLTCYAGCNTSPLEYCGPRESRALMTPDSVGLHAKRAVRQLHGFLQVSGMDEKLIYWDLRTGHSIKTGPRASDPVDRESPGARCMTRLTAFTNWPSVIRSFSSTGCFCAYVLLSLEHVQRSSSHLANREPCLYVRTI